MKLRDYQATALREVMTAKHVRSLIVAPTGAGKGTMAVELLTRAAEKRQRAIFCVHRRELVTDMRKRLDARGFAVADNTLRSDQRIRVITVQTLLRSRRVTAPTDLFVVDEAHHYAADEWRTVLDLVRPRKVVGFTATPQRPDGRSMGDMFDELVDAVSYSELLHRGFVVPCRVLRPQAALVHELAQQPADAYLRYGRGEQTLMFVSRIADAEAAAKRLNEYGAPAAAITSKTPDKQRVAALHDLEQGKLRVVINVGVLTEGVDVPHVSCVVLARPCAHASTYVQIVGRVLRAAPGKVEGTLIDLVGASHKHGLPAADREHSLSGKGIELSDKPRERDPRDTPNEQRAIDVLDLELEVIEASRSVLPFIPPPKPKRQKTGGRKKKPPEPFVLPADRQFTKPSENKYAPRTRPLPAAMTPGFLFEDRGFWQLGWSEHGKHHRMGLATRNHEEALELLVFFREHGPTALREEVRMRKRTGCCVYFDRAKTQWFLCMWDEKKIQRLKFTTYAPDEESARSLVTMVRTGNASEARKCIAEWKAASGITYGPPKGYQPKRRQPSEGATP